MMPQNERRREVPAVTRAIAILRRLGASDEPLGVSQLSRELALVPSTCLHILRVLKDEGLVAFDPHSKRYAIDVGILPIARRAIQRNNFANLIQPHLTALSTRFGVTAIATRLIATDHMVVVAMSQASLPFRLQVDLGSRFPALISATGRCMAAFSTLDDAALRDGFDQLQWDHPPSFDTWMQEVRRARDDGFAVDQGAYISGVSILAVPFFDTHDRMTQSMVAIGISKKIEETGVALIARRMLEVRDEIATMLMDGPD